MSIDVISTNEMMRNPFNQQFQVRNLTRQRFLVVRFLASLGMTICHFEPAKQVRNLTHQRFLVVRFLASLGMTVTARNDISRSE